MAYETTMPRDTVSLPTSPNKPARKHDIVDQNSGKPGSELSAPVTSIIDGETTGVQCAAGTRGASRW